MRLTLGGKDGVKEFICGGCGYQRQVEGLGSSDSTQVEEIRTESPKLPPLPAPRPASKSSPSTPKAHSRSSAQRKKKSTSKARRLTELRKLSRTLVARVNDIEIQFDRRLEDLQQLAVDLQRIIEEGDD